MVLSKQEMAKAYNEGSMGIIEKIKTVLTSPSKFFNVVKSDQGFQKPFAYFAIVSLISTILGLIVALTLTPVMMSSFGGMAGSMMGDMADALLPMTIAFAIGGWVISLIVAFIAAAILHIFVLIVGGAKGYTQTYKAMVYGSTPSYILGWIPFIGIIFAIWTLYLEAKGISILHEISMGKAILAVLLPIILLLAIVGFLFIGIVSMFMPTIGF